MTRTVPAFDRVAHIRNLESLLEVADYEKLKAALHAPRSSPEVSANLDWLGEKFKQGNSAYLAFEYSPMLLAVTRLQKPEDAAQLRGTALAALLYAVSASRIEGRQCADRTAWSNRADQFSSWLNQPELLQLEEPLRAQAALIALAIERATWERRKRLRDAKFLCANGMAAIGAGIRAGAVREVPVRKGLYGREMAVTVPKDFVYERRRDEEWWPEAEAIRAQLPELLRAYAKTAKAPDLAQLR